LLVSFFTSVQISRKRNQRHHQARIGTEEKGHRGAHQTCKGVQGTNGTGCLTHWLVLVCCGMAPQRGGLLESRPASCFLASAVWSLLRRKQSSASCSRFALGGLQGRICAANEMSTVLSSPAFSIVWLQQESTVDRPRNQRRIPPLEFICNVGWRQLPAIRSESPGGGTCEP